MDLSNAFALSASGLTAHRLRMDVIAANLANANSTTTPEGGPYRRRDVVLRAEPQSGFDDLLAATGARGMAVRVAEVVSDKRQPRMSYDPGHPHANADGYVAVPNIDVVTEMVDLMAATRAYEANVAALNATKRVLETALEIGQG